MNRIIYLSIYLSIYLKNNIKKLLLLLIFPIYLISSIYAFGFIYIFKVMEWRHLITAYLIFFLVWHYSKPMFILSVIIHTIMAISYFTEFKLRGGISLGGVVSLMETNQNEIKDYFLILPSNIIYFSLLYIILSIFVCIFYKHLFYPKKMKYRYIASIFTIWVLIIIQPPISLWYSGQYKVRKKENQLWFLIHTKAYIISRPALFSDLVLQYYQEKEKFNTSHHKNSSWKIQEVNNKHQNYILIIGESMRKDYLSLYGYPLSTTPFLEKSNGIFVDGYVSSAGYTAVSLERSLYRHDIKNNNTHYSDNIITLAQKAGFKTYWLTNQNMWGIDDNTASRIAKLTDEQVFIRNNGNLNKMDRTTSDMLLLPELERLISQDSQKPRLFILHLMGSHSPYCARVVNRPISFNFINQDMSCYLESLKQTDELIEQVINIASQQGSYSLLYFSDHGLYHHNKEEKDVTLFHGTNYKQNYEVPLFVISSHDTERKMIKTQRSAFNFIHGFAQWLQIKETSLNQDNSFFSEIHDKEPIKVFNGQNIVDFNTLPNDPSLYPDDKKKLE